MTPFDRLKTLADKQGLSVNDVERRIGLGRNTLYSWKKKIPSGNNLIKVADFFHVSTDFLLGRSTDSTADLDDDDVIFTYQGKPLSDEDKALIKRLMNGKN